MNYEFVDRHAELGGAESGRNLHCWICMQVRFPIHKQTNWLFILCTYFMAVFLSARLKAWQIVASISRTLMVFCAKPFHWRNRWAACRDEGCSHYPFLIHSLLFFSLFFFWSFICHFTFKCKCDIFMLSSVFLCLIASFLICSLFLFLNMHVASVMWNLQLIQMIHPHTLQSHHLDSWKSFFKVSFASFLCLSTSHMQC